MVLSCYDCGSVDVCTLYDTKLLLCKECFQKRINADKEWLKKNKGYY